MKTPIIFLSNLLSVTQIWGGVATLFLLVISFIGVHAVKLSSKGYFAYRQAEKNNKEKEKKTETPPPSEPKAMKETQAAPIYYLVEKKRIRKKPATEYAEPKRIQFDNER